MPLLGSVTSFLDKYLLAYALGTAAGPALEPFVQDLANEAWTLNQVVPPSVYALATGVAQGQIDKGQAAGWAHERGFSDTVFDALIHAAKIGPGTDNAFQLWHRGIIDQAGFERALLRLGLEPEWIAGLVQMREILLTPAELANARQQQFITPQQQLDEAAKQGIDNARAEIQYELAGLPPGIETALQMLRRKIIAPDVFKQIVAEGHTKTKYTDDLLKLQDQVLSAQTYAGLHLRGWIGEQEMVDGGALTGYTKDQLDLLYKEHGRPATGHQVFIGLRRGGEYDGPIAGIPQPFVDAIKQSNIRPEWTNLLWAGRYVYPSSFVLRGLTQSGDLTGPETEQILLYEGWEPKLAATVSARWAGGTGAKADPHVAKAETQLWNTAHSSYKAEEIDRATATATLGTLGVAAAAQPQVLALWDAERALIRAQLTPAQIKKALGSGVANPATGQPWTFQEGIDALLARGYDLADATVFLQE